MAKTFPSLPVPTTSFFPASIANAISTPTWDIILIFSCIGIGFFYGITRGRHKMLSSMLNTYVALALFASIPLDRISKLTGVTDAFYLKTGIFLALWFGLLIFFSRGRPRAFARSNPWWQVMVLSIMQAGLILHMIFSFLPVAQMKTLAPLTRLIFANPDLHTWWLAVPIAVLILLRKMGMKDE